MVRKQGKTLLETWLESFSQRLFRILKIKNSSVGVFLLGGAGMRRLGRKYLKKKKKHTPDVLSFREPKGFPHPERRSRFLGEIYINRDIARRNPEQARAFLIHGLLHILGYTHNGKTDTLKMEKLEKRFTKLLAVSCQLLEPPFSLKTKS